MIYGDHFPISNTNERFRRSESDGCASENQLKLAIVSDGRKLPRQQQKHENLFHFLLLPLRAIRCLCFSFHLSSNAVNAIRAQSLIYANRREEGKIMRDERDRE